MGYNRASRYDRLGTALAQAKERRATGTCLAEAAYTTNPHHADQEQATSNGTKPAFFDSTRWCVNKRVVRALLLDLCDYPHGA